MNVEDPLHLVEPLDPVEREQLLGRDQHLGCADHPLRDGGPEEDAVLRRDHKVH